MGAEALLPGHIVAEGYPELEIAEQSWKGLLDEDAQFPENWGVQK